MFNNIITLLGKSMSDIFIAMTINSQNSLEIE